MTAVRRFGSLLLLVPLSASTAAATCSFGLDEVQDAFQEAMNLLDRGNDEDALVALQQVLALDPGNEAAYELWRNTETRVWLDLLEKGGQYELVARELMELGQAGRRELSRDTEAIRPLVVQATSNDVGERRRALQELYSVHGAFAVPMMLPALANRGDEDRRVLTIQALTNMSSRAVPPLIQALGSSDEFLRRNVAYTLGYIGDQRAAGSLAWLASTDPDPSVRDAATEALQRVGGSGDAEANFLALADAYARGDRSVLGEDAARGVVWSLGDNGRLEYRDIPPSLVGSELAKADYYNALTANPASESAIAGLARVYVSQLAELEARQRAGADVGDLLEQAQRGLLAIEVAGTESTERALAGALAQNDEAGAIGLLRVLGSSAAAPSPALGEALSYDAAAVRAEAAMASGEIAVRTGQGAGPEVVRVLGESAGREIVRIAAVIGPRSSEVARVLEERGMLVNSFSRGAMALAGLRRMPGVDLIAVADTLPDLTLHQVLVDIRSDDRFAGAPILVVSDDPDQAASQWGEMSDGVLPSDASDTSAIDEVTADSLDGARGAADRLSARAAALVQALAIAGHTDVAAAMPELISTLASRPDEVVISALKGLGAAGALGAATPVLDVLADAERSDEVRHAAANALAGILSRDSGLGGDSIERLMGVLDSDASLAVRAATARALGRFDLAPEVRAEVLRKVRVDMGTSADG